MELVRSHMATGVVYPSGLQFPKSTSPWLLMLSRLFRRDISNLLHSLWVCISWAVVEQWLLQGRFLGWGLMFHLPFTKILFLLDHSCWAKKKINTRLCAFVFYPYGRYFFFLLAFVFSIVFYQLIVRLRKAGVHNLNMVWQLRDSTDMIRQYRKMRKNIYLVWCLGKQ